MNIRIAGAGLPHFGQAGFHAALSANRRHRPQPETGAGAGFTFRSGLFDELQALKVELGPPESFEAAIVFDLARSKQQECPPSQ